MKELKCPACGAQLSIKDSGRDFVFCEYCGAKIILDDYRSTHRIVDEAKIHEVETNRIIRLKELELEEKHHNEFEQKQKLYAKIWLVATLVIIIFVVGLNLYTYPNILGLLFLEFGVLAIAVSGVYIFKTLPNQEKDSILLKNGAIKFPKLEGNLEEQNYEVLKATLLASGFSNITCINLHDIKLGLLQKENGIKSISIDGNEITSGGRAYMPDASIVITYHGR